MNAARADFEMSQQLKYKEIESWTLLQFYVKLFILGNQRQKNSTINNDFMVFHFITGTTKLRKLYET